VGEERPGKGLGIHPSMTNTRKRAIWQLLGPGGLLYGLKRDANEFLSTFSIVVGAGEGLVQGGWGVKGRGERGKVTENAAKAERSERGCGAKFRNSAKRGKEKGSNACKGDRRQQREPPETQGPWGWGGEEGKKKNARAEGDKKLVCQWLSENQIYEILQNTKKKIPAGASQEGGTPPRFGCG